MIDRETLLTDDTMIGFFHENEKYGCFSNWYPAEFEYARNHYKNVEQYMMYQKVLMFHKYDLADKILKTADPYECKKIGRTHFPEFDSELWNKTCKTIVKRGVKAKFLQNPTLLQELLDTGNKLIAECSPYDKKWGIGIDINDPSKYDVTKWKGANLLGRILMEIREELKTEIQSARSGEFTYVNAFELAPITEWNMTAGELKRIPQYYDAIHAYADTLSNESDERNIFYNSATLHDLEVTMRVNMGGGLPLNGFYEMKQDIYDIARRIRITDKHEKKRMEYCEKYIPFLQMIENDSDLKKFCSEYSVFSKPGKHDSVAKYIYGNLMKDAYTFGMVIPDYAEIVSEVLTDAEVAEPTEDMMKNLSSSQVLGCIAWHFRRDHFSEGALIFDSIANGYMLMLLKAFADKTHIALNYSLDSSF